MERKVNLADRYTKVFLVVTFILGFIGHGFEVSREAMITLTPWVLLIASSVVCYPAIRKANNQAIIWLVIAFAGTFVAEVIGVKSGLIFGDYKYGEVLGVKVFEVPLIIGINWVLVMLGAISLGNYFSTNTFLTALIAALIAVIFDIILEPVAITLGYWKWSNVSPPLSNYNSWFVIVFILAVIYGKMKVSMNLTIPRFYLFVQTLFFLLLQAIL
ncbi:MAG: carotenoid biosynthesis protein [Thermodesulfobacteriota bacterium]|nr:carotenoid biosynthesis protein [Thermodesulfobacteriota bacterium]